MHTQPLVLKEETIMLNAFQFHWLTKNYNSLRSKNLIITSRWMKQQKPRKKKSKVDDFLISQKNSGIISLTCGKDARQKSK